MAHTAIAGVLRGKIKGGQNLDRVRNWEKITAKKINCEE